MVGVRILCRALRTYYKSVGTAQGHGVSGDARSPIYCATVPLASEQVMAGHKIDVQPRGGALQVFGVIFGVSTTLALGGFSINDFLLPSQAWRCHNQ